MTARVRGEAPHVVEMDYRLNGRLAAELAGFTLATAALTRGMGALIPPEVARAALQVLGPRTLLKYQLHQDEELFDKAYGYVKQYY